MGWVQHQWLALVALLVGAFAVYDGRRDARELAARIDLLARDGARAAPPPPAAPRSPPEAVPSAPPQTPAPGGEWDCRGKIAPEEIRKVVEASGKAVFACYSRRADENKDLKGSVFVQLRISEEGRVVATKASGSLTDEQVVGCVTRLAREWRFPPPSGGPCAVVTAPFGFGPES